MTSLGGTWMVEQPENSVLEFFPPFQAVLAALHDAFGGCAVPIHCKQVYKSYINVAKGAQSI